MIKIIGNTNTIIGMGLCGLHKSFEVSTSTPKEIIINEINSTDNDFILINEEIFTSIKDDLKKSNKKFIKIPDVNNSDEDFVDKLARDTLGMKIK